jgi:hypothetical protein
MQFTGNFDTKSISFSIPKKKENKKMTISVLFQKFFITNLDAQAATYQF